MLAQADRRGGGATSSANRQRTRADANGRRWRASRSAGPVASSARRLRARPRPADRSDGSAAVRNGSLEHDKLMPEGENFRRKLEPRADCGSKRRQQGDQ
jgi:hypothetical protein